MAGKLNTVVVAAVLKHKPGASINTATTSVVLKRKKGSSIQTKTVAAVLKRKKGASVQTHTVAAVVKAKPTINIINPGADTCDLTGWTQTVGDPQDDSYWFESSPCCWYGGTQATGTLEQVVTLSAENITLISGGDKCLLLNYWKRSWDRQDKGHIVVTALTAANAVIHSSENILCTSYSAGWKEENIYLTLPPTTAKIKIEIKFERVSGSCWMYFDSLVGILQDVPYETGIQNPGGEDGASGAGNLSGWLNLHGDSYAHTFHPPNSGSRYLLVADYGNITLLTDAAIAQFVELDAVEKASIALGTAVFDFSYWYDTTTGVYAGYGDVEILLLKSDGSIAHTLTSAVHSNTVWANYNLQQLAVHTDVIGFKITLHGQKQNSAQQWMDPHFDDLSYTVTATASKIRDRKHAAHAIIKRKPAITDTAFKAYNVLEENPTTKLRVSKTYGTLQRSIKTREYASASYAVMFDPPNILNIDFTTYGLIKRPVKVRDYSYAGHAIIADPNNYVFKQIGTTTYKLQAKLETDKIITSSVYTHKAYAETGKIIVTAVYDPGFRPFLYNYTCAAYAIIEDPLLLPLYVKAYKNEPYAVIQPPIEIRMKKTEAYAIWWTPPIIKQMTEKTYAMIRESEEQLRTWDVDGYAAIHFDGDFRDRKQSAYAPLVKLPPVKEFSTTAYTFFIEPGVVNSYKSNSYALMFYPLARMNRVLSYGVLRANKCVLRKGNHYALFHTFNVLSLDKVNDYAILEYEVLPTKSRKLNTYAIVIENPDKSIRERTQKSYVVHGEKQPLVATNSFTSYLCLGAWPDNVAVVKDFAGYCLYEGQYHRLWDTTSYGVLWEAPTKFVKNYARAVYVVHGTPPEVVNTDYHKVGGYVRN